MLNVFNIESRSVGKAAPAYIIAEVGSNHDAELARAKELIKAAAYAGADAVKFQSFTSEGLLNPLRPGDNGAWEAHPALEVITKLALPESWHKELKEYSAKCKVTFLSAPFDESRAELLDSIGVAAFKIASGEITNEPLLVRVGSYGRPVILSTGASYMAEVERGVEVLTGAGCSEIALLHCTSLYPPKYEELNLRAMVALKERFGCPVGLSDHTRGSVIPAAAVALGASIIEKHITLDRSSDGPDHSYAMEVEEFRSMVTDIRNLEKAMGDGVKRPSDAEMGERIGARRSVYADVAIEKGSVISPDMLKVVRHAYGLEPAKLDHIIGSKAARDILKDMPVKEEDLCR